MKFKVTPIVASMTAENACYDWRVSLTAETEQEADALRAFCWRRVEGQPRHESYGSERGVLFRVSVRIDGTEIKCREFIDSTFKDHDPQPATAAE